jgi:hypothetical protein
MRLLWFLLPLVYWERRASECGALTLQQVELADGPAWQCSIRSRGPGPRYSWIATRGSIKGALAACAFEAVDNPIKAIEAPCVPKLGGAEFDPE